MAPVTKCKNQKCEHRFGCFRHVTQRSQQPNVAVYQPDSTGRCGFFIPKLHTGIQKPISRKVMRQIF